MNGRESQSIPNELKQIEQFVSSVGRRLLWQHRLHAAIRAATGTALIAIVVILAWRLAGFSQHYCWWLLALIPALTLVRAGMTGSTAGEAYRVAKQIDRQLNLHDQFAGGYDLLQRARSEGGLPAGPFTELLVADAATALDEARRKYRVRGRLPAGVWKPCALSAIAASLPYLIYTGPAPVEQANRMSETERKQIASANEALLNMAKGIAEARGVSDESKQKSLELIKSLSMSQEQLNKMTKADFIRKLKEIDAKSNLFKDSPDAAVQRAVADNMQALKDMEQINKELAELDTLNKRKGELALDSTHKVEVAKIELKSTDISLKDAVDRAVALNKQPESEVLKQAEEEERRRDAQRKKLTNYVPKTAGSDAPKSAEEKYSQMIADNKGLQAQVLSAMQDSTGAKMKEMNGVIRPNLEREIQNDNIPLGMRNQLRTYSDQLAK